MRATSFSIESFWSECVLQQDHVWFDLSNFSPPLPMRESRFAFRFSYTETPSSYLSIISHISPSISTWLFHLSQQANNKSFHKHSNNCITKIQDFTHWKCIPVFFAPWHFFWYFTLKCLLHPPFFSRVSPVLHCSAASYQRCISSIHNSNHTFLSLMRPCVSHCL